jgi:hypothetical protein
MRQRETPNPFIGPWRIVRMSAWDQDDVDMEGPGHITFGVGRSGSFQFGLVQGEMDCKFSERGQRVDFTWSGFDEGTEHMGRGHAQILNGELHGHLHFHQGDDSAFRALREPLSKRRRNVTT